ncbi:hypothetical protein QZH41_016365, partial [Actinostola sp. cb2023]
MSAARLRSENKYPTPIQSDKANPKCLLRKYLTKELFESLKDKKTSRGVSLWDCINSGVANLDSGTGVYAGDEESYQVFSDLFDKVIEDYHAPYKLTDGHVSDMNPEKVDAPNLDGSLRLLQTDWCLRTLIQLCAKGDRFLEAAGANKLWPEGRGIFHNSDKTFLVWINEEDQLRIISMEKGSDI